MKVNKKRLAEIFNVDPRTIERWQSQGLPCASKGSKGIESVFDTAMAIQWYAQRETDIENEKLRKELDDLRAAAESDLQPGTIDYERYRLTKAQADAQELKNAREDGVVLETELFTFILQRVAQEISGILVRVPLTLQRKYPDISPSHLDVVKTESRKPPMFQLRPVKTWAGGSMISDAQKAANAAGAIATGLLSLIIPVPLTTVQWANKHYYLPKESSYTPGRWETLPFQVGIMNCMGNDLIRTVNLIKSARVGYTKMLLGVEAYFIEHKSRNSLLFQPTDSAAEDFMKSHVEPTIRDVPALLELAPWFGRKHRDNTLTLKRFSSGVGFWCLGGAAAKNYREKSVDVVCYDELSSFEPDVEKEGSPTLLGDKRIEGSVWPKSIRGSTPKIKGSCQIEKAANESAHFMRFYVPCPHCGEEQYLKFGDDASPFGLKWEKNKPESVFYLCEHHGCVIHQSELDQSNGRWICENTGMWTRDGLMFFSARGDEIPPPRSITFHIWTAYSPFTTWVQIVYDWLDALKDPNGLKTFVNTTLGETWEEAVGEKLDHQVLMDKVVRYTAAVPARVVYLTAGIDSQRNRFEMYVWGWAPGEEAFLVDKIIIMGRPDEEETLLRVDAAINKKYRHADGTEMTISRVCWDIGGIDGEIVYQRSKNTVFPGAAGKRRICLWQAGDHHAKNPQSAGRVSV